MKSKENTCLNCEQQLDIESYCPNCGQKAIVQDLSLKYLFTTFLSAFINFDAKLLRSLKDVWVPNRISLDFLSGKREQYINHIRFLFICLVIFFGLVSLNLKNHDLNKLDSTISEQAILEKSKEEFDSLKVSFSTLCPEPALDSLGSQLFDDRSNGNFAFFDVQMNYHDAYFLPADSLMNKYKVNGTWKKILFPHALKAYRSSGSITKFVIGNMLWGIIILTLVMAAFLKLIYFRHGSYYIEHVMHIVNFHCIMLILFSVLLIFELFLAGEFDGGKYNLVFLITGLHLTYSLKQYYNDKWWKSLIKGFLIFLAYVTALSFVALLIIGVSIMIF